MKFIPKTKKFNKVFKIRPNIFKKVEYRTIDLKFGTFGIKSLSGG